MQSNVLMLVDAGVHCLQGAAMHAFDSQGCTMPALRQMAASSHMLSTFQ